MGDRSRNASTRESPGERRLRSRVPRVRREDAIAIALAATVALVLVALAAGGAGIVAADPAAASVDDRAPSTTERTGSLLDGENGTVELVVRFDPVFDPAALGVTAGVPATGANASATVADLREHADAERAAFESFAASRPGITIEREFWLASALLVSVDAGNVTAADLRAVENVTRIHENVVVEPIRADGESPTEADSRPQIGADPSGRAVPGVRRIGAPTAWERFDTRGAGATVAVVDTGVDPGHRDVALAGWASFGENGTLVSDDLADASDPDGHGTHVAGTVAGGNASGTYIGVAPAATLYGIDAFGDDGTATFAGVVASMQHATVAADADVLQLSLGANGTFRGFVGPVRNARATGTVVVAAIGNEGVNASSSPANAYDAVAVGAVDEDRRVPPFSGGGRIDASDAFGEPPADWPATYVVPDVTAPGVRVASAAAGTNGSYVFRQGTSMAAPHVSGIAALAVAATDGRTGPAVIESALVDTAVHPANATEPDDRYGHGVVDAPAAVEAAVEAAPPASEATDSNGTVEASGNGSAPNRDDTRDEAPGFGAVAAVVAVAAASAAARVRRE
jgi:subtilisin family serine protease